MITFEPFQKVLVRESVDEVWKVDFYSHEDGGYIYLMTRKILLQPNCPISQLIIPYYEKTKILLGTPNYLEPDHEESDSNFIQNSGFEKKDVETEWKPKPGTLVAVSNDKIVWFPYIFCEQYKSKKEIKYKARPTSMRRPSLFKFCEPLREHFIIDDELPW